MNNAQKGLFAFESLWKEPFAVILLLRVITEATSEISPFEVCRQLTRFAIVLKRESSVRWNQFYVGAIAAALVQGWGQFLHGACSRVIATKDRLELVSQLSSPLRNGHQNRLPSPLQDFANALERSDYRLRISIWWEIFRIRDQLDHGHVSRILIDILLTPIPGFKSTAEILASLPPGLVDQLHSGRPDDWPHVSAALRPGGTPRKRKRANLSEGAGIRKLLPTGDIDGDSVRALIEASTR